MKEEQIKNFEELNRKVEEQLEHYKNISENIRNFVAHSPDIMTLSKVWQNWSVLTKMSGEIAKSIDKIVPLYLPEGRYGRTYQDNPDILVFPESNDWAFDVECTEQGIDLNNKLSKLANRTKLLSAKKVGIPIYPVLVTKFPRAILNDTEKDKAEKERISIITSDDFATLIQMAIKGVDSSKTRDYILGLGSSKSVWNF